MPKTLAQSVDRFFSKVQPEQQTGCHLWTDVTTTGYGYVWWNGRKLRAHRVAWELAHGPIPEGMHVLHRCDVPLCVNVDHLFLGDAKSNAQDRQSKGRSKGTFQPAKTPNTHCREGHEFTPETTLYTPTRECRICRRARERKRRQMRNG